MTLRSTHISIVTMCIRTSSNNLGSGKPDPFFLGRRTMEEEVTTQKSALEAVANMAEFANAVASMVVGHRRILVEGGFDVNLADQMAASLHAQTLGLVQHWDDEDEMHVIEFLVGEEDDDSED